MVTRRHFLALSGAAALWAPHAARAGGGVATFGGSAFGSYWRLTAPLGIDQPSIAAMLDGMVVDKERVFSPYRPDSVLTAFNMSRTTGIQPTHVDLRAVLASALEIAASSEGAFDPAVGPIVGRYGFGPLSDGSPGHFSQLAVDGHGIGKDAPGLCIDLCGIAKGHALDAMRTVLAGAGVTDYLLDLGGELTASGRHPSGRDWQVMIDGSERSGAPIVLALAGRSVATSGNAAQGYELGGRRVGHIIDPHANVPAAGPVYSVSVLSENALIADGWATALMAAPYPQALAMAGSKGIDALFLVSNGGRLVPTTTGRFGAHLVS
ncbi:FAD:protein FMN transferase [Pelagibacterium montanilacus]|uniref:FAD:protein FMN transferase n=1 Tax=Pelagibacterium montanilacus TaxID=2185280 RepID=UPI000F8F3619|nr:FAD:protein FMN transferase [Pelagibacterium montanilacus]